MTHCLHPLLSYYRFDSVANVEVSLYSAQCQMEGKSVYKTTVGKAVTEGTIANETLGYFMARIQSFLVKCGVDPNKLRFRFEISTFWFI